MYAFLRASACCSWNAAVVSEWVSAQGFGALAAALLQKGVVGLLLLQLEEKELLEVRVGRAP